MASLLRESFSRNFASAWSAADASANSRAHSERSWGCVAGPARLWSSGRSQASVFHTIGFRSGAPLAGSFTPAGGQPGTSNDRLGIAEKARNLGEQEGRWLVGFWAQEFVPEAWKADYGGRSTCATANPAKLICIVRIDDLIREALHEEHRLAYPRRVIQWIPRGEGLRGCRSDDRSHKIKAAWRVVPQRSARGGEGHDA